MSSKKDEVTSNGNSAFDKKSYDLKRQKSGKSIDFCNSKKNSTAFADINQIIETSNKKKHVKNKSTKTSPKIQSELNDNRDSYTSQVQSKIKMPQASNPFICVAPLKINERDTKYGFKKTTTKSDKGMSKAKTAVNSL